MRRRTRLNARKGIALMLALVCLVLIALVTSGLYHLSLAEARRSRAGATTVQAQGAADAGALDVVRRWQNAPSETLSVGGVLPTDTTTWASARALSRVVRISPFLWHAESVGESGDSASYSLARRRVSTLFTLAVPDLGFDAALTVRDSLHLSGTALVSGADTVPPQWSANCTSAGDGSAVATPDSSRLCDGSCATHSGVHLSGVPPILVDPSTLASLHYLQFGAESWSTLTGHAATVLPPNAIITPSPQLAAGACDRLAPNNWGDPGGSSPCSSYAPIIWARGDLEVRGGAGQGLLLVDGDITISQGARFDGVIIAQDDIRGGVGGGRVTGLAMAADSRKVGPGDHSTLGDDVAFRLSRCTALGVLMRSARLRPVTRRWWVPIP